MHAAGSSLPSSSRPWRSCLAWIDAPLVIGMAAQFSATYNFTDSAIAVDLLERDRMTAPSWIDGALYGSIFGGCIFGQARVVAGQTSRSAAPSPFKPPPPLPPPPPPPPPRIIIIIRSRWASSVM
jgi:hypothetical protein